MKKIILGLSALILTFVVACNKTSQSTAEPVKALKSERSMTVEEAHALGVYDDSSQDTEEQIKVDDSPILNLNTRSATMNISSITTDTLSFAEPSDRGLYLCGKYRGLPRINFESMFRLRGSGFGTSKGSSSVVVTINNKNYTITEFQQLVQNGGTWTDTLIYFGFRESEPLLTSALVNELKYGNFKVTLTKGTESVSKTIKAVSDWYDGNNTYPTHYDSKAFGQPLWNVANERHKMGKQSLSFITNYNYNSQDGKDGYCRKISPSYVPEVGDLVYRAYSQSHWNDRNENPQDFNTDYEPFNNAGVIMVVGNDVKGVRDVTIWEMNMKCTGALQKKKYKFMYGLFIPKKDEFPFFGYAR